MNTSKTTPTPWGNPHHENNVRGIIKNGSTHVAFFDKQEDAQFCIRAVNNHQQLLNACENAYIRMLKLPDGPFRRDSEIYLSQLCDAIADVYKREFQDVKQEYSYLAELGNTNEKL